MHTMAKKRPGQNTDKKKPTRTGVPITVWIDEDIAAAMKRYISEHELKIKQTAVIEVSIKEYLRGKGYWPPPKDPAEAPNAHHD